MIAGAIALAVAYGADIPRCAAGARSWGRRLLWAVWIAARPWRWAHDGRGGSPWHGAGRPGRRPGNAGQRKTGDGKRYAGRIWRMNGCSPSKFRATRETSSRPSSAFGLCARIRGRRDDRGAGRPECRRVMRASPAVDSGHAHDHRTEGFLFARLVRGQAVARWMGCSDRSRRPDRVRLSAAGSMTKLPMAPP